MERLSRIADPKTPFWRQATESFGTSVHDAVRQGFTPGSYDNNRQADRAAVGKALIDMLYE